MSVSLSVQAYSSKESKEFQKHLKAVKFCIENELSYPVETIEFFDGNIGGDSLDEIGRDSVIEYIENGVEIDIPLDEINECEYHIKVSEIPKEVDLIIVKLS